MNSSIGPIPGRGVFRPWMSQPQEEAKLSPQANWLASRGALVSLSMQPDWGEVLQDPDRGDPEQGTGPNRSKGWGLGGSTLTPPGSAHFPRTATSLCTSLAASPHEPYLVPGGRGMLGSRGAVCQGLQSCEWPPRPAAPPL